MIFFGSSWSVLVHADWLAAGIAATACAAVLAMSGAAGWKERAAGPSLFLLSCWAFYRFGAAAGEAFPPPVPGLEVLVLAIFGLILACAGLYLGFMASVTERELA